MIGTSGWRPWRRYLCVAYRPNDGPPQTFAALLARHRVREAYAWGSWCTEAAATRLCRETNGPVAWPRIALEVSREEIALAELAEVR